MTKLEQAQFLLSVLDGIRDVALGNLDKIPDEWEGTELMQLIREIALSHCPALKLGRKMAFEHAFLERNLDTCRATPAARARCAASAIVIDNIAFPTDG